MMDACKSVDANYFNSNNFFLAMLCSLLEVSKRYAADISTNNDFFYLFIQ
jgi:hypothetical protein